MAVLDVAGSAIDRIRLAVVDYQEPFVLTDGVIEYYLGVNGGNEGATIKQCAGFILGTLSQKTQVALDRIVVHGQTQFDNYLRYLKQVINSPTNVSNGFGGVYVGGVSIDDILANNSDPTIVQRRLPIYPPDCDGEYAAYETPTGF